MQEKNNKTAASTDTGSRAEEHDGLTLLALLAHSPHDDSPASLEQKQTNQDQTLESDRRQQEARFVVDWAL